MEKLCEVGVGIQILAKLYQDAISSENSELDVLLGQLNLDCNRVMIAHLASCEYCISKGQLSKAFDVNAQFFINLLEQWRASEDAAGTDLL